MSDYPHSEKDLKYILSAQAVKDRAKLIFNLCKAGKTNFIFHQEKLEEVADIVISVIMTNYPDLKIPYHSRWGHFKVGGIDRIHEFNHQLQALEVSERAKSQVDLVIVSVLLDAGAGPDWKYQENGQIYSRSEGLAVASIHMFNSGLFSSDRSNPYQADSIGLKSITAEKLAEGFQVSAGNPIIGLEGRAKLLNELGNAIEKNQEIFPGDLKRPGNLFSVFAGRSQIKATEILQTILNGLGPIWPGRIQLGNINLGDVWQYNGLSPSKTVDALVPFHKLSQWLSYSLIEVFEWAGINVESIDELTPLAEYRNGGLLIDSGLIEIKDKALLSHGHSPSEPLIIEWRALTIELISQLAIVIRKKLQLNQDDFPLVKILEGGTWWAGRKLASQKRKDGSPPLKLTSDGTVF